MLHWRISSQGTVVDYPPLLLLLLNTWNFLLPCGERTLKFSYYCVHTLHSPQTSAVKLLLYFDSKQLAHSHSIIQVTDIYDQFTLDIPNTNAKQKCINHVMINHLKMRAKSHLSLAQLHRSFSLH